MKEQLKINHKPITIQHDSILLVLDKTKNLGLTHRSLGNYFNYHINTSEVPGSTAALMMIRKKIFMSCGMFNENYETCFEDVELNLKCLTLGLKNYYDGSLVSYHLESQTRNDNDDTMEKQDNDYVKGLLPFINLNFDKINKQIMVL